MLAGASGVISVAANVVPEAFARLCALASAGDGDEAAAIDGALRPLYEFLGVEPNPIPVKWLLHRMGRIGPALRLPLLALDPAFHGKADELIARLQLDVVRDVA
jgi:4-hydroxy-tetrahydrodipicolinate synthase